MAGEGDAWVRDGPMEQSPLLALPRVQEPSHLAHTTVGLRNLSFTQKTPDSYSPGPRSQGPWALLPQTQESRPPALSFHRTQVWAPALPSLTWKSLVKTSNSKMDTWPLQVRSMVERKARVVGPDSTGWQVHRRDSNSAQGSTHLGRGVPGGTDEAFGSPGWRTSRKEAAGAWTSGCEGGRAGDQDSWVPWQGQDEAPGAPGAPGTGAHSPGSTVLSPEGVGFGLGELVCVSTVLSPGE